MNLTKEVGVKKRMNTQQYVISLLITCMFILSGCVSANYEPPQANNAASNYTKTVNQPFDEVWNNLIQYSASTFFAIDNFEKDSGLITLTFGASNPQDFITGGHWKFSNGAINFSGDYVEYTDLYQGGRLSGKMNIVVTKVNSDTTKVTVNARYIFTGGQPQTGINTWSFDSGSCDSIAVRGKTTGTQATRTICPTYKAEKAVLSAL